MPYDTRYCAYVDILGFGELIDKLDRGETPYDFLKDLLTKVHNPPETIAGSSEDADFRAQSISDAVALSAADNIRGLGALFHSVNQLAVTLLQQGFFIRGAIVKDKLHHDDKMIFGRALVRAYRLESTVARYPRVMVTREVVDDIRDRADEQSIQRMLRRADDGPMFLHVLREIEIKALPFVLGSAGVKIDDTRFSGRLLQFCDIPKQLQRRFDEATDNPAHFDKVKWVANYWNDTLELWGVEGFEQIKGPGVDRKAAVWG
ncbi:MAG TPA: hypothetical protein VFC45_13750 [Pseudolabrys sp.]|nr:hypothetical protein [Pseudolabrys sp.]